MTTLYDIFEALPPSTEVAKFVGTTDRAVRAWRLKDRQRIPGKHWPALVRLGRQRGIKVLTYENLEAAHKVGEAA
tara:strand:+ start:1669 stop:1893 length:225 start_codon:yes stop_codon:yes gene_type:complete